MQVLEISELVGKPIKLDFFDYLKPLEGQITKIDNNEIEFQTLDCQMIRVDISNIFSVKVYN